VGRPGVSLGLERKDTVNGATSPVTGQDRGGLAALTPQDIAAAIRKHRQGLVDGKTREFIVPGWERMPFGDPDDVYQLVARYVRLDGSQYHQAVAQASVLTGIELAQHNAQFLIDALTGDDKDTGGLFLRYDGNLYPLIEDGDAGWHDFAEQWCPDIPENAGARDQVILGAFAGNTLALEDHALEVARWMEEGHQASDRQTLGG
jgi:hypothetical protein